MPPWPAPAQALRKQAQIVALDLTLLPFYGADAKENDQIYRSQAKRAPVPSTPTPRRTSCTRGTLHGALMAVTRKPTMEDVTKELLRQVRKVGIHVRFLVLDRGFYSVAVIRYLQAARMPFLMPVVATPQADHPLGPSGSQVFKAMKRSGWFEYTLSDPRKRTATVQICVKCRNRRGRGKKAGALDLRLLGHRPQAVRLGQGHLPEPIRGRTSYRQMNQCRIRTTTTRFAVRFLYVAIGFLMRNLWVWLHYAVLSSPHRGCRRYNLDRLTLRTMLLWLQEVAFSMYELVKIALCERSVPERLTC